MKVLIVSLIVTIGIITSLLIAIPIQEHNTITYVAWTWSIPVYKYTACDEKSWTKPPKDAYNVRTKREYRRTITKTDSNGNTHKQKIYDTRYYYTINKWDFAYYVNSTGIDRSPFEASPADIPYIIQNPQLGDIKRGNREEKYECNIDGHSFEISKADWSRLEKGCDITYKRHRLSKKIYDIKFN